MACVGIDLDLIPSHDVHFDLFCVKVSIDRFRKMSIFIFDHLLIYYGSTSKHSRQSSREMAANAESESCVLFAVSPVN